MAETLAKREFADESDVGGTAPLAARKGETPDVLERAIAATHQDRGAPVRLSRHQKAAIIVRLLMHEANTLSLESLPPSHMADLVRAMSGLSYVDEATTLSVIQEFLAEFDTLALYFRKGMDGALETLERHLNDEVRALIAYTPPPNAPIDPWETIRKMEVSDLLTALAAETPQVVALTLAKLDSSMAADVLGGLDQNSARAVALAASRTGRVEEKTLFDIGVAILATLEHSQDQGALPGDPAQRLGQILNFAPGATRENLLQGLENSDPEIAERIRRVMFTFADIPDRVEVKDVVKVVRAVENDVLVKALAGAAISEREVNEFILSNLSKRLSEQLTEEIKEVGEIKVRDADAAMNAVVRAIRDLETDGEITLIAPDE